MAKILGIDLGTTNSAMAIIEGGEPKSLKIARGTGQLLQLWHCQKPESDWLGSSLSAKLSQIQPTLCLV